MTILFILLLVLAIWAAFRFGGVRKAEEKPRSSQPFRRRKRPDEKGEAEKAEEDSPFRGKGGRFGGGGASGDWND
ncbi:hypothetical protein L6Q21_02780 [Sandaracinobacter sp. RS1-74]|uniref:hypothetical protein n=1 Tax=Sandaracinobacteroides sayramensis TaxID=2913411 RepID=UPI001EDC2C0D|nr:hypothetical protein [Sandaracinobacteroides sayramensis]MCG2839907.1 hypothetical protein [Sandaracinobacteroides sayramensis]